jgi:hypothetical protein
LIDDLRVADIVRSPASAKAAILNGVMVYPSMSDARRHALIGRMGVADPRGGNQGGDCRETY